MRYQNTINLFQQNIFIQQVNININIYPIINTMLKDLNIAFSEFKTACEFSNEAEVREKALSVLARYRSILDNKRDFYQAIPNNYIHMNNYNELNKNQLLHLSFLETGLILLSTFLDNAAKFDSEKIAASLYTNIIDLYEYSFPNTINNQFWYNLKLFEFLLRENIIHNWNISRINFTFTEDQLEDFFTKNRKTILKDIRSLNNIFNPLDNYEINIIFQMHKKIESFKEKFESKKLVTVN